VPTRAVPVEDSVKELLAVAGFVAKPAVTPTGRPDALKFTLLLKPFKGLMVMVVKAAPPWSMVKLAGDAERVKPGCGVAATQLLTRLAALTLPMPVAKSQPTLVP